MTNINQYLTFDWIEVDSGNSILFGTATPDNPMRQSTMHGGDPILVDAKINYGLKPNSLINTSIANAILPKKDDTIANNFSENEEDIILATTGILSSFESSIIQRDGTVSRISFSSRNELSGSSLVLFVDYKYQYPKQLLEKDLHLVLESRRPLQLLFQETNFHKDPFEPFVTTRGDPIQANLQHKYKYTISRDSGHLLFDVSDYSPLQSSIEWISAKLFRNDERVSEFPIAIYSGTKFFLVNN